MVNEVLSMVWWKEEGLKVEELYGEMGAER
jgi:hypothetical protein